MVPPENTGAAPASTAGTDKRSEQLLLDLLDDAKVVAAYVQRAGLLRTTLLPEAISAVENNPVKSWGDPAVVKLQVELNSTMNELSPTTLEDLKGPTAPFSRSHRLTIYNLLFLVAWAAMILLTALGTLSHNYGTSIVVALEDLETNDTGKRIAELVRTVVGGTRDIKVAETQTTDYVAATTYLANLDEAKALDEKTSIAVDNAFQYLADNMAVLKLLSLIGTPEKMFSFSQPPATPPATSPATPPATSPDDEDPRFNQLGIVTAENEAEGHTLCTDQLRTSLTTLYSQPEFGATPMAEVIRFQNVEGISLTCMSGFHYHLRDYPPLQKYIGNMRSILNVYGLWLLPALYGALGAAMYHLRRALNPILPTPPFLRTINRTIMGAFAGIIIAWFWAPAAQSNAELVSVGFNLFAIAFLVGYGIDVFFTFLDRVLVTATGSIGRLGTNEK